MDKAQLQLHLKKIDELTDRLIAMFAGMDARVVAAAIWTVTTTNKKLSEQLNVLAAYTDMVTAPHDSEERYAAAVRLTELTPPCPDPSCEACRNKQRAQLKLVVSRAAKDVD